MRGRGHGVNMTQQSQQHQQHQQQSGAAAARVSLQALDPNVVNQQRDQERNGALPPIIVKKDLDGLRTSSSSSTSTTSSAPVASAVLAPVTTVTRSTSTNTNNTSTNNNQGSEGVGWFRSTMNAFKPRAVKQDTTAVQQQPMPTPQNGNHSGPTLRKSSSARAKRPETGSPSHDTQAPSKRRNNASNERDTPAFSIHLDAEFVPSADGSFANQQRRTSVSSVASSEAYDTDSMILASPEQPAGLTPLHSSSSRLDTPVCENLRNVSIETEDESELETSSSGVYRVTIPVRRQPSSQQQKQNHAVATDAEPMADVQPLPPAEVTMDSTTTTTKDQPVYNCPYESPVDHQMLSSQVTINNNVNEGNHGAPSVSESVALEVMPMVTVTQVSSDVPMPKHSTDSQDGDEAKTTLVRIEQVSEEESDHGTNHMSDVIAQPQHVLEQQQTAVTLASNSQPQPGTVEPAQPQLATVEPAQPQLATVEPAQSQLETVEPAQPQLETVEPAQPQPESSIDVPLVAQSTEEIANFFRRPAVDIDAETRHSELYVGDYARDIIRTLKETELRRMPSSTYMQNVQFDIDAVMRAKLTDWLVEVAEEYGLHDETLLICFNYIDRFLSTMAVHHTKLQLVGVACMLLASKFEEIRPPSVDNFVFIAADTYRRDEVIIMESTILDSLQFNLVVATPLQYLPRFLRAVRANVDMCAFAMFMVTLISVDYNMLKYRPSVIAAVAVSMANQVLRAEGWSSDLSFYSMLTRDEVRPCLIDTWSLWRSAFVHRFPGTHVLIKFSQERYRYVGRLSPPNQLLDT